MGFPSLGPQGGNGGPRDLLGWDRLVIGNTVMPGKWKITNGKIVLKIDHAKKAGTHGANPKFHGLDPHPFDAEGYFWTDEQMQQLYTVLPPLLPQPGKDPTPLYIAHPDILHLGLAVNMVIIGASALERDGNARKIKLYMLHWLSGTVAKNQNATAVPVRSIRNVRDKAKRDVEKPNPKPTEQPNAAAPPANLGSGR